MEPSSSQAQTSGHEARTAQRVAHDSSLTPGTWLLQGDSARCSRLSMRTACSAVARAACICACLCAAGSFFSPFVSRCRIAFALLTICGAPGQGTRTHRHLLGQLSPESRPLHAVSHRSDFMSTAVLTQCRRPSRCSPTADGCSGAGAPSVTQSTASIYVPLQMPFTDWCVRGLTTASESPPWEIGRREGSGDAAFRRVRDPA